MTNSSYRKLLCAIPWLVLAALLPIMIMRDFTPSNELRYLSIADEAIRGGHVFTFYNQGIPYADKPPMYLWIVMAGRLIFGQHLMWFLALFSFVPAIVTAYVMDRWVSGTMACGRRLAALLMLMSSGLFLGLAIVLRMDMLLTMFITLALYTYWKIYTCQGRLHRNQWLFGLWVFLAIFAKGPMGILIPLLSVAVFAALKRSWHVFAVAWGWRTWTFLIAACGAWFAAVWVEGGNSYLNDLLFNQTINRAVDSFTHKRPFWYYAIVIWYAVAPWCLLVVGSMVWGIVRHKMLNDMERFFLTVSMTTFVMLSCISSKLGVYILPAIPFMVYFTNLSLLKIGFNRWIKLAVAVPATILVLTPVALPFVAKGEMTWLGSPCIYSATLILAAGGLSAIWMLYRRHNFNRAVASIAVGLYCAAFAGGIDMKEININSIGYREICRIALDKADGMDNPKFYTYKLNRASAINVFLGVPVQELDDSDIDAGKGSDGILLTSKKSLGNEHLSPRLTGSEIIESGPNAVVVFNR